MLTALVHPSSEQQWKGSNGGRTWHHPGMHNPASVAFATRPRISSASSAQPTNQAADRPADQPTWNRLALVAMSRGSLVPMKATYTASRLSPSRKLQAAGGGVGLGRAGGAQALSPYQKLHLPGNQAPPSPPNVQQPLCSHPQHPANPGSQRAYRCRTCGLAHCTLCSVTRGGGKPALAALIMPTESSVLWSTIYMAGEERAHEGVGVKGREHGAGRQAALHNPG